MATAISTDEHRHHCKHPLQHNRNPRQDCCFDLILFLFLQTNMLLVVLLAESNVVDVAIS
jgi:hypothetical protein